MKSTTMKRIMKIITVLLIVAMFATLISSVFAKGASAVLKQIKDGNTAAATQAGGLTATVKNIIGVVQVLCYVAAVIMLIYLGLKWVTAAPDGKAEIKKMAIIYVIGAIVVFASGSLLGIIANVATQTVSET